MCGNRGGWGDMGWAGEPSGQELSAKALSIWDSPRGKLGDLDAGESRTCPFPGRKPWGQGQGSSCFQHRIKSLFSGCKAAWSTRGHSTARLGAGEERRVRWASRARPLGGPLDSSVSSPGAVARHPHLGRGRGAHRGDGAPMPCVQGIRTSCHTNASFQVGENILKLPQTRTCP